MEKLQSRNYGTVTTTSTKSNENQKKSSVNDRNSKKGVTRKVKCTNPGVVNVAKPGNTKKSNSKRNKMTKNDKGQDEKSVK
jgi:hypothetical protein